MPQQYPIIYLKAKKEIALTRQHPWVFSGAIKRLPTPIRDGEVVQVHSHNGRYLATGHYQANKSIAVRICSFALHTQSQTVEIDAQFWQQKIGDAYRFRLQLGLFDCVHTNAFRLVNAEGDGLPSLIIDFYDGVAVLQAHTLGMYNERMAIAQALQKVLGNKLRAIYDKSAETLPKMYRERLMPQNGYIYGNASPSSVLENNYNFWVDWETGQKTGFFIVQRDNRQLLGKYVKGKKVLNAFCYSGGFSVYALGAGASLVHSIDSSKKAIAWTDKNVRLLQDKQIINGIHKSFVMDVMCFLQETSTTYDVLLIDPPAYAKHVKNRHKAVQGYKRLNVKAMQMLNKGGLLFTFSCSGVVNRRLFYDTIVAAAIEAKRQVRVLHHLSQPPCHPTSIYHPEGAYLKGLVVQVF